MSSGSARDTDAAVATAAAAAPPADALAYSPAAPSRTASSRFNTTTNNCSGREQRRTSTGSSSDTVGRLYKDPYAEALAGRRLQERSVPEAAVASGGRPSQPLRAKTVRKVPPQTSARRAGSVESTPSIVAASTAAVKDGAEVRTVARASSGSSPAPPPAVVPLLDATADSPLASRAVDVLCVVLPEAPALTTPRVSAAAGGSRLDLRAKGLTALPCLHSAAEEGAATNAVTGGLLVAHGSGDSGAVRLHAVNLRENRLRTLLTPFTRLSTSSGSLSLVGSPSASSARGVGSSAAPLSSMGCPRSTPLQCYLHVSSLDLTHNELTSIAGVEALRCLRSLRLAFNRLTSLAPLWASPYIAELDVLDVSSNALTELITAEDVRALESHNIRVVTHPTQAHATTGGQRSTKSTTTYKSMRLRVLYASSNALSSVPAAMYTLSQLADLRLRRNVIRSVPEGFPHAACLPALARLDLSMNALPPAVVDAITARVEGGVALLDGTPSSPQPPSPSHRNNTRKNGVQFDISHNVCPSSSRPEAEDSDGPALTAALCSERAADKRAITADTTAPPLQDVAAASDASTASVSLVNNARQLRRKASQDVRTNDTAGSPTTPPKRSRGGPAGKKDTAAAAAAAVASLSAAASTETRSAAAPPPPTFDGAVQSLGENVYCVNVQQWAAALRHRLSTVLRPAAGEVVDEPAVSFTTLELLTALSDSVGSCVAMPVTSSSAVAGGGQSASSSSFSNKGTRPRTAGTARLLATLQSCLPPTASLSFPEDTQTRAPPLLILTGLTAEVAADPHQQQLYDVLAHHLVQNCIVTPKTAAATAVGGGAAQQQQQTAAVTTLPRGVSPPPDFLRSSSTAEEHAAVSSTPPPLSPPANTLISVNGGGAPWRVSHDRVGRPAAGSGNSSAAATRPPSLHAPLQVIHVLQHTDKEEGSGVVAAAATTSSATSSLLLWGYVAWRRSWETACGRRRLKRHDVFVGQRGENMTPLRDEGRRSSPTGTSSTSQLPPSATAAAAAAENGAASTREGVSVGPATRCATQLCPFPCTPAATRLLECRRLNDVRPAAYSPLPAAWEVLYEQASATSSSAGFLPPLLTGGGDRVGRVRGCAVSLASLLLCAVEHPSGVGSGALLVAAASASAPGLSVQAASTPFRRLGSAVGSGPTDARKRRGAAPTTSASGGAASVESEGDVLARAAQTRLAHQRLADRIAAEVTTVASEQVPPCAMPLYNARDVEQSQAAALLRFMQWSEMMTETAAGEQVKISGSADRLPEVAAPRTRSPSPQPQRESDVCSASSSVNGSAAATSSFNDIVGEDEGGKRDGEEASANRRSLCEDHEGSAEEQRGAALDAQSGEDAADACMLGLLAKR